jgi:hypothetical protein
MSTDPNEFQAAADALERERRSILRRAAADFDSILLFDRYGSLDAKNISDDKLLHLWSALALMVGAGMVDVNWNPAMVKQAVEEEMQRRGLHY